MRDLRIVGVCLATLVGCEGSITLYDNLDPADPRVISSEVIIGDVPNCGCPEGTSATFAGDIVPDVDRPVVCNDFRPIRTRREGAQLGFLKVAVEDEQGVGCVQVVVSGSDSAGIASADANDPMAAEAIPHGPGQCPGHEHTGHSSSDTHYRFEFDASRTQQAPVLSFYRYGEPLGWSGGISYLAAWVQASYSDGDGRETKTVPVYVTGPLETWACFEGDS